jgi:hypothetical protein
MVDTIFDAIGTYRLILLTSNNCQRGPGLTNSKVNGSPSVRGQLADPDNSFDGGVRAPP